VQTTFVLDDFDIQGREPLSWILETYHILGTIFNLQRILQNQCFAKWLLFDTDNGYMDIEKCRFSHGNLNCHTLSQKKSIYSNIPFGQTLVIWTITR